MRRLKSRDTYSFFFPLPLPPNSSIYFVIFVSFERNPETVLQLYGINIFPFFPFLWSILSASFRIVFGFYDVREENVYFDRITRDRR